MDNNKWNQILSHLSETYDKSRFDTWFKPLVPIYDNNKEIITLSVKTRFNRDFLDQQYSVKLLDIINSFGFIYTGINFVVENETSNFTKSNSIISSENKNKDSKLNNQFTFDNFISGPGNEFAKSVTLAVSENPGKTKFNPLLIYGGVGLGKTHLLQAIGNFISNNFQDKIVKFITSEDFTNDFVDAIKNNESKKFSEKYKALDVLLIDDIQFIAGKERTQEEFFHIFNTLHNNNKQIVLTSDQPPNAMQGLHDRLVSRFNWGLCVDIQPPDLETRLAILKRKAERDHLNIPENILYYIAENVSSNIRNLEGIILKLFAKASITNTDITLDLVKNILGDNVKHTEKKLSIDDIIDTVSDYYGIPANNLREKNRSKEVAHCRQVAMFISKNYTNYSLKTIGLHFGGRDHSTVIHAVKQIGLLNESDPILKKDINTILSKLNN